MKYIKIADKNKQDSSQPRRSKKRPKHGGRDKDRDKDKDKDRDKDKEESSINGKQGPNFQNIIGTLVSGKFKLVKLLGSGSYGKFV